MLARFLPWRLLTALLLTGVGALAISISILYNTTVTTEISKLQALAQSHGKLINSVAQYDAQFNKAFPNGNSRGATLYQVTNAHFENIEFGSTGEIVIGEIRNGKIYFLIPSRVLGAEIPPVDQNAKTAEPMRRALLGRSGSMLAPDYRGRQVLAWYEPIPDLDAGIVAKINISEIRKPFETTALVGFLIAITMSVLSCVVFVVIGVASSARQDKSTHTRSRLGNRVTMQLALIACLTFVGAFSVASVVGLVFSTEIDRQKGELLSLSEGMASLIGAVADFDLLPKGSGVNSNAAEATISQVKRAAKTSPGFGLSGEIVLGTLNGTDIEFLLPSRFTGVPSQSVSFEGTKAEPMRRALSGQSGVIEDLDYRGVTVVAAFQPIRHLKAGLVTKMDLKEIKDPYFLTALIIVSLSIFIIVLGTLLAPHIVEETGLLAVRRNETEIALSEKSKDGESILHYTSFLLILFAGFIFLLDYSTPLGVAAGIPYIALLIIGAFFTGEKGIYALTILATVLVFSGWVLGPDEGAVFWKILTNRLYAVFTIALAAIILVRNKKAEKSVRESELRTRTIIENATDGIITIGEQGLVQSFSPAAEEIFGFTASEVIGKNIKMLMPEPTRSEHDDYLKNYLQTGEGRVVGQNREVIGLRKDGTQFSLDLAVGEAVLGDEHIFTGIVRDITDRKRAESELHDARDAAEEATKAKANFLSAMSHEIRTPMNGVVGMIDLLRESTLDADQLQMVDTVKSSAYSLLTIINDILDFSKIEAGKLDLEEIPISIADAVEGVGEALAVTARNKNIRLCVYVDPDIPDGLIGDQVRLRQIIFNLGGNAIKFTEQGKVLIRADRMPGDDDDQVMVRLQVIDDGIGIPEAAQKTLFQAFSQVDASTTRRFGGTGLGLSICQRLVELMGGEIGVNSVEGEGSTFHVTVTLPVAMEHSLKSDREDLQGLKVLSAFGDPELRDLMPRYLEHWGAKTEITEQLTDVKKLALKAVDESDPFDVIVLGSSWPIDEQISLVEDLSSLGAIPARFVLACQKRSRKERKVLGNTVYLDADPMQRGTFIRAVAVAAGRASPDVVYEDSDIDRDPGKAPTVEAAEAMGQLILLAEDNLTNQNVIKRQLAVLGYAVEIANDGVEALAFMKKRSYALLLSDCHMPNMDGFELTKAIRKEESGSPEHFPVIAVTASVMKEETDNCFASGMDDFLAKPLEMDKLRAKLRKWMPVAEITDIALEPDPVVEQDSAPEPRDDAISEIGPIDPSALKSVFGDDEETFREILKDFVGPSMANAKDIETAFENRSASDVAAGAHKLKSSSRSVGATELADICNGLETAGKNDDWNTINELVPRLPGVMQKIGDYIENL